MAVIDAPPATNDVTAGLNATVTVDEAIENMLNVGPAYDAGVDPASTIVLVKVPDGGALVAGDAGPVMLPRVRVSENPGGSVPVHWTADG